MNNAQELFNDLEKLRIWFQDEELTSEQRKIFRNGINLGMLLIKIKIHQSNFEKNRQYYVGDQFRNTKNQMRRLYNQLVRQLKEKTREQTFFDEKIVTSPSDKRNIISYQYDNENTVNYQVLMKLCTILKDSKNIEIIDDFFSRFEHDEDSLKEAFLSLQIMTFIEKNWLDIQKYYQLLYELEGLEEQKYFDMKQYQNIKNSYEKYNHMNFFEKKLLQKQKENTLLKLTSLESRYKEHQEKIVHKNKVQENLLQVKKTLEEKGWFSLIEDFPEIQIRKYIYLFECNQYKDLKLEIRKTIEKEKELKSKKLKYIKEYSHNPLIMNLLEKDEKTAYYIRTIAKDKNIKILLFLLKSIHELDTLSLEEIKNILDVNKIENYEEEAKQYIAFKNPKVKQLYS